MKNLQEKCVQQFYADATAAEVAENIYIGKLS